MTRALLLLALAGCATAPAIVHPQPVVADTAWSCVGGVGPTPEVQILEQAQLTCRNSPVPGGVGRAVTFQLLTLAEH